MKLIEQHGLESNPTSLSFPPRRREGWTALADPDFAGSMISHTISIGNELVLDTCVIVAGIRSETGASRKLLDLASEGEFTPVLSGPLIAEYEDVIHRPENQVEGWTTEELSALIDSLLVSGEWATTHFSYRPMLPDAGDELVLEAAVNGQADIVSFNKKHFKPAARFGIRILRPAEALQILGERRMAHGAE